MIYLDHNATTPVDLRVLECMQPYWTSDFANASSIHGPGQKARHAVEKSREMLATAIGAEPADIVFTSGGTEANNTILRGILSLSARKKIIVSRIEHSSVLDGARQLSREGFEVVELPVSANAVVDLNALQSYLDDQTALVSVMHVNNEVGAIEPVAEIARLTHERGALFHTDAVQSFGKIDFDCEKLDVDLATFSAHKIYGPKGIGAFYCKKGVRVKPMLYGGHQQKNMRPGTENVAAIVGFAKALELSLEGALEDATKIAVIRDQFERELLERVAGISINAIGAQRIYNTSNITFESVDGEMLLVNMDRQGLYASTGSACAAGSVEPSHVLLAMGLNESLARSSVRFSFGRCNLSLSTAELADKISGIIGHMRKNKIVRNET